MILTNKSDILIIFTDAATSPTSKISVGVYLALNQDNLIQYSQLSPEVLFKEVADKIFYTKYESKKSTWSEIKTVIDALDAVHDNGCHHFKIEIYTDCQSLCDLLNKRKEKLEKNNFLTKSGKVHPNIVLYKELFLAADKFEVKTYKVKGHSPSGSRITIQEKIFGILDKLSRKRLRLIVNGLVM
ncbi:hypothetical protein N9L02_00275 [Gammaproteobacteria bacterium]|nr:hypothetical protein [Gammaproteobacteria bacterium]